MFSRFPLLLRLLLAIALPLLFVGLAGCGSDKEPETDVTRYEEVRGRFMGTASDGRDVVIHHEEIPDVMRPMVMSLPIADRSEANSVEVDDPVAFDLVISGSEIRVENLRALPDTATLDLPAPEDSTSNPSQP
jgi:Cu/Ag efflux protein CusF